jgi:hypothetical protein
MLFLADESCDFAVVRALRDGGHDVLRLPAGQRTRRSCGSRGTKAGFY